MSAPLDPRIEASLNREIFRRSLPALLNFIVFLGVLFIVPLNTSGIRIASLILLVIASLRLFVYWKTSTGSMTERSYKVFTRNIICVYAPLWGYVLQQMMYQNHFSGMTTIIANFLMVVFVAGSWSTLGPDLPSFMIFCCSSTLPTIFALFWMLWQGDAPSAAPLAALYPIMFFMSFRNGVLVHKELVESLTHRFSFEDSQKKLLEEKEKEQLATRLASLGVMASGLAHEINNPLMIASGLIQRSMRKSQGANPETLNHVHASLERIAKIVKALDLLGDQGKSQEFKDESLSQMIQSCLETCQARFAARNIQLRVDPIPAETIHCYSTHFSQLILGILNNAFEAITTTGRSQGSWVQMSFKKSDQKVLIQISDSGPGISRAVQDKIFDPFFSTKAQGNGSGLGLSIARSIAREHGGELRLVGGTAHTCFEIELPLASPQSVSKVA